jgi:enoyl-CoA hydratase
MIRHDQRGPIFVAEIDRGLQNVIDSELVEALDDVLDRATRVGSAVLHLRAAGPNFCGGASPARVAAWLGTDGASEIASDVQRWNGLFDRIESAPLVVLAELRGNVLGAGLGLALACDLRIAAASARIGVPEVRVGLLPAGGTVGRLVAVAGKPLAQRLLVAGDLLDGDSALREGLVHWCVADAELEAQAAATATRVAAQSAPALREAKAVLRAMTNDRDGLRREQDAFARLLAAEDPRARIGALLSRLAGRPI